MLAKMRRFRGTALDVFGKTAERKQERALIAQYETLVDELLARLTPHNYELAVSLRSEEHTSELQSPDHLVCRLLLEKKKEEIKEILARRGNLEPVVRVLSTLRYGCEQTEVLQEPVSIEGGQA